MPDSHCSQLRQVRSVALRGIVLTVLFTAPVLAQPPTLPDAAGRDVVQRVCGACHPATMVLGHGMTRDGWATVVANMITRGAKGSPADFQTITDYLAKNLPPNSNGPGPRQQQRRMFPAGPQDRQIVDPQAAAQGQTIYASECASCHGNLARGTANAPDLVRSDVVLHDRYGNELGPYLQHKHPKAGATDFSSLTKTQIEDLSHFLHEQVENTLRSGPYTKVLNVLTGNAEAGAAYFNGPGQCAECHSATGDLAGIASKFEPAALQQRLLFPRTVSIGRGSVSSTKPVTVTVTPPDGQTISGTLVYLDDFNVALRDNNGNYHSWKRTPQLRVEVKDPYAAHDALLDKMSDADIHNVVAYLETLK